MKTDTKYVFWNADEFAHHLIHGIRKNYNFTFDTREDIRNGYEPCGWHGILLCSMFDSIIPNMLAIGYWGGGESVFVNLEKYTENEAYETAIHQAIADYLKEYEAERVCVELVD